MGETRNIKSAIGSRNMKNLEIKAKYRNHENLERLLKEIGTRFVELMHQVDTYFSIPTGRLKLREIDGKRSELIYYQRGEKATKRWNDYYLYSCDNPKELKSFLSKVFPTKVVIDKKRTLYQYRNARIHVDMVKNLGNFIEIEVEVKKGKDQAEKLMKELLDYLKIPQRRFIKKSYSDLLTKKFLRTKK